MTTTTTTTTTQETTNEEITLQAGKTLWTVWQVTETQVHLILSTSSSHIQKYNRKSGRKVGEERGRYSWYSERFDFAWLEEKLISLGLTSYKSPKLLQVEKQKKADKKTKTNYEWQFNKSRKVYYYKTNLLTIEVDVYDTGNCAVSWQLKYPEKGLIKIERQYKRELLSLTPKKAMAYAEEKAKELIKQWHDALVADLQSLIDMDLGEY